MIGQNPGRRDVTRNKTLIISKKSSIRGIAGGLDANTYDWRDLKSGIEFFYTENLTTLNFLRNARDYNATPLLTVNCRSFGTNAFLEDGAWDCASPHLSSSVEELASLAGDWVYYVNHILRQKRKLDILNENELRIINSIHWGDNDKLLNQKETTTPKVEYWEISNEADIDAYPKFIINHRESPEIFAKKYAAISKAMKNADPSIKVGPCVYQVPGNQQLAEVLKSGAPVDFISYHPYYGNVRGAWQDPDKIETAIMNIYPDILSRYNQCVGSIRSYSRPDSIQQIASEWNSCMTWYNDKKGNAMRVSAANALAVAETVFTFADLGFRGAHYWDRPSEEIAYDVFNELNENMGNYILDSFTLNNFKMYTVINSKRTKIAIWALNIDNDLYKYIRLILRNCPYKLNPKITYKVLKPINGTESNLIGSEPLRWETKTLEVRNPNDIEFQFRNASITVVIIDISDPFYCP